MITVETWDDTRGTFVAVDMWDAEEVAKKLAITPERVRKLARDGVVHPYPASRMGYYDAHDISTLYQHLRGLDTPEPGDPLDVDAALGRPVDDDALEGLR